jgi:galactokinase
MSQLAAVEEFQKEYGRDPEVIAIAPGRINLIGEHTDYNEGFVFPAAIDKCVYLAASIAPNGHSSLRSMEVEERPSFDATKVKPGDLEGWGAYAAGMAWAMREAGLGESPNVHAVVSGDVPIGSGVSSSAALELAFGVMWLKLTCGEAPMKDLALIAQKCENKFVGVNSGIMDQMASAMGKAGSAMFLDTRSLEIEYAKVPDKLSVVICDTKKPRALTTSAYNERRSQCEQACRDLGVKALRDADMNMLEAARQKMDPVVYKRARHVITEDSRCVMFKEALEDDDQKNIGVLMRGSHESLRDDYEVSSFELDQMAAAAWDAPGCVGARMTGAGFGGACVALVTTADLTAFTEHVQAQYRDTAGLQGEITPCKLSDGAHAVDASPASN